MTEALSDAMREDFDKELHALIAKWAHNCAVMEVNPGDILSYPLLLHAVRSLCILAVVNKRMNADKLFDIVRPLIKEQFDASFGAMREEYEVFSATERARQS